MLQELLSIFRPGNPLSTMADDFARMLKISCEMNEAAGSLFFKEDVPPESRTRIYKQDVRVNKLQRSIRKRVVTHLSGGNKMHLPYCLLLMSLVKDVERLGDYAKNLGETPDLYAGPLPDDQNVAELREIRAGVEEAFRSAAEVFARSDRERALELILTGKELGKRADNLVVSIARTDYESALTAVLVLGARYYKRIGGHLLNVLSAVVMPLHKIDYYDEDEIPASIAERIPPEER